MDDESNREASPPGIKSRRRLVRSGAIGAGAFWVTPVVESYTSPAAESSTSALVGIGAAVSGRGISPIPPAQGTFRVLLATSQEVLTLQLSSGWTPFMTNVGSMSLSGWYGGTSASNPTFIAVGNTTAVILGFNGSTTAEAGPATDGTERTIGGAPIGPAPAAGVVLFVGGTSSPRAWSTPSGYSSRVAAPVPDASNDLAPQLLVWDRTGAPANAADGIGSFTTGPDVVTTGVQVLVR